MDSSKGNLYTLRYCSFWKCSMVNLWDYNSFFLSILNLDLDFYLFNLYLKMSYFTYTWNRPKPISIIQDINNYKKVFTFFLRVFYNRAMDKIQVFKPSQNRIWTSITLFCISKCHLSHRLRLVKRKLVYFEISFIVPKLSLYSSKCSTVDLCL